MKTLRMYPTSLNERFLDEAVDVLEKVTMFASD